MTFASRPFALFVILVLGAFWLLPRRVPRDPMLLIASWYFYAVGRWPYLALLVIFTTVDYVVARLIATAVASDRRGRARWLLALSVGANIAALSTFKLSWILASGGERLLLPIGISFYTFQSISYVVDVYRQKIQAHRNFVQYALYIAFFPQLLAGPIERARPMLAQLAVPWYERAPTRKQLEQAAWLIFWGLLKKVAIADRLAPFTNWSITGLNAHGAGDVWFGSTAFTLQFFADFSAYTDLARGVALLFGLRLAENFRYPYFATSPRIFWQRWHITLGAWFRDYVYGPLVRRGWPRWVAIFMTMTLVGLWHGAEPKFIVWGAIWGGLIAIDGLVAPKLPQSDRLAVVRAKAVSGWLLTMAAWILSGFFFVARDLGGATTLLRRAFDWSVASRTPADLQTAAVYLAPLLMIETYQWVRQDRFFWFHWPRPWRVAFALGLALFFLGNYADQGNDFIYFAF